MRTRPNTTTAQPPRAISPSSHHFEFSYYIQVPFLRTPPRFLYERLSASLIQRNPSSSAPSPLTATLFITIIAFPCYGPYRLVYSIHDSTAEVAIQRMIDASKRMLDVNSRVQGQAKDGWGINPVMKRQGEAI